LITDVGKQLVEDMKLFFHAQMEAKLEASSSLVGAGETA